jgi:hypothetical protein
MPDLSQNLLQTALFGPWNVYPFLIGLQKVSTFLIGFAAARNFLISRGEIMQRFWLVCQGRKRSWLAGEIVLIWLMAAGSQHHVQAAGLHPGLLHHRPGPLHQGWSPPPMLYIQNEQCELQDSTRFSRYRVLFKGTVARALAWLQAVWFYKASIRRRPSMVLTGLSIFLYLN